MRHSSWPSRTICDRRSRPRSRRSARLKRASRASRATSLVRRNSVSVGQCADPQGQRVESTTRRVRMDTKVVAAKITQAKEQLLLAEQELEAAMLHFRATPRAHKTLVGAAIERAFDKLKAAR